MRIHAVTFDFWGTLYESGSPDEDERSRRRTALVRSLLVPHVPGGRAPPCGRLAALLYEAGRLRAPDHRALTAVERLGWVAGQLELSVPERALEDAAAKVSDLGREVPPRPVECAGAVVEDLSRDFALGLVCDTGFTDGRALRRVMSSDGLAPPIRAFSFSDETGVSKPHADAFLPVLRELGVEPGEAVHIGDLVATDVAGACGVGMRTVWIGRGTAEDLPEGCAAAMVRSLAEVPDAIRSMR